MWKGLLWNTFRSNELESVVWYAPLLFCFRKHTVNWTSPCLNMTRVFHASYAACRPPSRLTRASVCTIGGFHSLSPPPIYWKIEIPSNWQNWKDWTTIHSGIHSISLAHMSYRAHIWAIPKCAEIKLFRVLTFFGPKAIAQYMLYTARRPTSVSLLFFSEKI